MVSKPKKYEFHAVRVQLPSGRYLFAFPINGKDIFEIASIARVKRKGIELEGFQRQAVKVHIRDIAEYVKQEGAMIPNSIVIAFSDDGVEFTAIKSDGKIDNGQLGILKVPKHAPNSEKRPGWIVDGQQRTYAIVESKVEKFPIMVCAFLEKDQEVQAQHFVNVNSARTLPRELINELLPNLTDVPQKYKHRKLAANFASLLAFENDSPFFGVVKSADKTATDGVIGLNSLVIPLEKLVKDPTSYLSQYIQDNILLTDEEVITGNLKTYWSAVKEVFTHAWGLKPADSRLMHGCGIYSMFQLSQVIFPYMDFDNPSKDKFVEEVSRIGPHCHWTEADGDWEDIDGFGTNKPWKGFQNTAQDKVDLTRFLARKYSQERQKSKNG